MTATTIPAAVAQGEGVTAAAKPLHTLVIEPNDFNDDELTYRIECPYPAGTFPLPCGTWDPCGCDLPPRPDVDDDVDRPDTDYDMAPCPNYPGLQHQYDGEFTGEMCAGIGVCWPSQYDCLDDTVLDQLGRLVPGRYPVSTDVEDGCYLLLTLAPSAEVAP
jgi:hypothetical protein